MKIFTLYDLKSEKADKLFLANTIGEAERQFQDAITMAPEGNLLKSHPEHFDLYYLGDFDETAPSLDAVMDGQVIVNGAKLLENTPFKPVTDGES
jgi:hypothetical protein